MQQNTCIYRGIYRYFIFDTRIGGESQAYRDTVKGWGEEALAEEGVRGERKRGHGALQCSHGCHFRCLAMNVTEKWIIQRRERESV